MEFKLIIKKLNNTLSEEENTIFSKWYNESISHKKFFNSVKNSWQEKQEKDIDDVDIKKGWLKLQSKLKKRKQKRNYFKYAAAASIIALISANFIFNKKEEAKAFESEIVNHKSIEIGTDKATLTLEDGSIVALEKGNTYQMQNASSNGEELVYKPEKEGSEDVVVYNYLTIPRGGQFFIILSDGTKVWLNSESKLKYPVSFKEGETREVELVYGEAYFEVSPSTAHNGDKFKVHNTYQDIEVIGTQFNMKAYKDDSNIYTTLVEGKISVGTASANQILEPAQQADLDINSSEIGVSKVDIYNEISWKDGVFSFRRKPLDEIMKVLSRWYDVDVEFVNPELKSAGFNGVLGKDQNIEDILKAIKNFKVIEDYEIVDKRILLK